MNIYVQNFWEEIDPHYHPSICDRYFRMPEIKVETRGLELVISKDIVEMNDREIENEERKGSLFIISSPVR